MTCSKCESNTFNILDKSFNNNGLYINQKVSKCTKCGDEKVIISFPDPSPQPIRQVDNDIFKQSSNNQKCLFDGLPPGVYGLSCTCPKCRAYC